MDRKFVTFQLGPADLSQITFALSPGHELANAVRVLQVPGRYPMQWGWLRAVRDNLPADAMTMLNTVIALEGYFPDFLTATPTADLTPAEEWRLMRQTPIDQVRVDLGKVWDRAGGARRKAVAELLEHPGQALERIAAACEAFWETALAPHWPQMRRLLLADIGHRSRTLTQYGIATTFATLHERVGWTPGEVRVRMLHYSAEVDCQGSGLTLVPSVMGTPNCAVITEAGAQPTLFYPAHGLTETWTSTGRETEAALTALLGEGRCRVLMCLDGPRSTSETASLCTLAVSTASHHLNILRDAGLVSSTREGAAVRHARTVLGEALARRS